MVDGTLHVSEEVVYTTNMPPSLSYPHTMYHVSGGSSFVSLVCSKQLPVLLPSPTDKKRKRGETATWDYLVLRTGPALRG